MQIETKGLTEGATSLQRIRYETRLNFADRKQQPQLGINSIFVHFHIAELKIRQK